MRMRMPKQMSGVYVLYLKGIPVYVGASLSVLTRISHHQDKKFDELEIIWCCRTRRRSIERRLIKKHSPRYNMVHTIRDLRRRKRIQAEIGKIR